MTIEQLIADGKIGEAIKLLASSDVNLALSLAARFQDNERANRLGLITRDEYSRVRNQIVNAMLPNHEMDRIATAKEQIRAIGLLPNLTRDELNRMVRLANGIGYNTYKWVYKTDVHLPENVIFAIADDIMDWLG